MDEYIFSIILLYESIPFLIAEPLHNSLFQRVDLLSKDSSGLKSRVVVPGKGSELPGSKSTLEKIGAAWDRTIF
jgi:hypothetical protein